MFKLPVNGTKAQSTKPTSSTRTSQGAKTKQLFSGKKIILHPSYEAKMGRAPMPTKQGVINALNSAPPLAENQEAQAYLKMLDDQMASKTT